MDGMLSQDEINALLSGMDLSGGDSSDADSASSGGAAQEAPAAGSSSGVVPVGSVELSDMDKDAIGEVANISMGSAATTLYSLVNRKVNITTPEVELTNWEKVTSDYPKPCVFVSIKYTAGLDGSDILVLNETDVKIITDLMMGGDGTNTADELGELHLSAISEAMNQMMGSSATSLSTMLGKMIDISPPEASRVDITQKKRGDEIAPFLGGDFVKVTFKMQIGDLVDSSIMQLYPIDFVKDLCDTFLKSQLGDMDETPAPAPAPAPAPVPAPAPAPAAAPPPQPMAAAPPPVQPVQYAQPQYAMPPMQPVQNVNVQPAQFQSFGDGIATMTPQENIGLIMDVPLQVTVELGRTQKSIQEILDFAPGTIVELDKIAGEPVDVLVNGKFVAKGEVVVIEESFGVRVTEIVN